MNIQDLMTKPAVTCRQDDTLNTAAQLMWDNDCGAVPVIDDEGSVVGIVTDRDICMSAYTQGTPLNAIKVSNAMAKQVFSCRGTDSLQAVERLMSDKQIRRIPVVDGNNHPIGVVSLNDLARHAASSSKKNDLEHEVAETLAAICNHRPEASASRKSTQQGRRPAQQHAGF